MARSCDHVLFIKMLGEAGTVGRKGLESVDVFETRSMGGTRVEYRRGWCIFMVPSVNLFKLFGSFE